MHALLEAIQASPLSQLVTNKQLLETLHFIAFALQIGAVMAVSLRLVGVGRGVSIVALSRIAFRTAWPAFAAVLITGTLQFMPIATEVFYRPSFRAKLAILALALVTLVLLQAAIGRNAAAWDSDQAVSGAARALAVASLALWPAVIVVARLMYAFVQMDSI